MRTSRSEDKGKSITIYHQDENNEEIDRYGCNMKRDRQTGIHADRQTDRQTGRQRDSEWGGTEKPTQREVDGR